MILVRISEENTMKKLFIYSIISILACANAFALDTVFDSMDKATEVKLAPAVNKTSTTSAKTTTEINSVSKTNSLKEQQYTNMLTGFDDAQVSLRQELAVKTSQYNDALTEKKRAITACKSAKKELNAIKKEIKNVEKSKTMISKNLQTLSK